VVYRPCIIIKALLAIFVVDTMRLFLDESGNTQETIVMGLVAIPDSSIDAVNQLLTLRPNDPPEIIALYHRPDDKNKPREEFKYSDFKAAFRNTNWPIYRDFLGNKFKEISELDVSAYVSAFPNPGLDQNGERLLRLEQETRWLLHKWGHQNHPSALSHDLDIFCDQQVFHKELDFFAARFRNKCYVSVVPKGTDMTDCPRSVSRSPIRNRKEIKSRSSKTCKQLQLADFIAGAFRDKVTGGVFDFFDILAPICPLHHIRDMSRAYSAPQLEGTLSRSQLGYECPKFEKQ